MNRIKSALLLFLVVVGSTLSVISFPSNTSAAIATDYDSKLKRFKMYHAFNMCWDKKDKADLGVGKDDKIEIGDDAHLDSGDWFGIKGDIDYKPPVGPYAWGGSDGTLNCTSVVNNVKNLYDYPSPRDMAGDMGAYVDGSDWFLENIGKVLGTLRTKAGVPTYDPPFYYIDAYTTFSRLCEASRVADSVPTGTTVVKIFVVNDSGDVEEQTWKYKNDKQVNHGVTPYSSDGEVRCETLVPHLNEANAQSYAGVAAIKDCETMYQGNSSWIDACLDGQANPEDPTYCDKYNLPGGAGNGGDEQYDACLYGQKRANSPDLGDEETEKIVSCTIEGIGWIVCPVIRFLAKTTDAMYGIIRSMMIVQPGILDTSDGSSAYTPWQTVRNIANICFILVFIFMIYSYLTSAGLSNYNIKKMLPRIIVGALAVNLSFYICGLLVDGSNLLGINIYKVVGQAADSMYPPDIQEDTSAYANLGGWDMLALASLGVTGYALTASGIITTALLLPLVLSAALAVLTVVLVLTVRQALIVTMIIISPLAFVAWLLPNTEGLFKKWWSLFKTLLLLFPVVSLLFAGGALASVILSNVASAGAEGSLSSFTMQGMAAGASIAPVFFLITIMQKAGGAIGQLTGSMNNRNKGWIDRSKKFRDEKQRDKWSNFKAYGPRKKANGPIKDWSRGGKLNPLNALSAGGRKMHYGKLDRQKSIEKAEKKLDNLWSESPNGDQLLKDSAALQQDNARIMSGINRGAMAQNPGVYADAITAKTAEQTAESELRTSTMNANQAVFAQADIAKTNQAAAQSDITREAIRRNQQAYIDADKAKTRESQAQTKAQIAAMNSDRSLYAQAEITNLDKKTMDSNIEGVVYGSAAGEAAAHRLSSAKRQAKIAENEVEKRGFNSGNLEERLMLEATEADLKIEQSRQTLDFDRIKTAAGAASPQASGLSAGLKARAQSGAVEATVISRASGSVSRVADEEMSKIVHADFNAPISNSNPSGGPIAGGIVDRMSDIEGKTGQVRIEAANQAQIVQRYVEQRDSYEKLHRNKDYSELQGIVSSATDTVERDAAIKLISKKTKDIQIHDTLDQVLSMPVGTQQQKESRRDALQSVVDGMKEGGKIPSWFGNSDIAAMNDGSIGPESVKEILKEKILKKGVKAETVTRLTSEEAGVFDLALRELHSSGSMTADAAAALRKNIDDAYSSENTESFGVKTNVRDIVRGAQSAYL